MKIKWTKDKCKEESLKYNVRNDFAKNSYCAYNMSRKRKWLDEICSHMYEIKKPKGYWTKEKCKEEALKYNNTKELKQNNPSVYDIITTNNWYDELCDHMINKRKRNNYWTKEKCKEEALKYNSRSDFQKNSTRAYIKSRQNGWLNDFCSHMNYIGNRYKRCIYAYEFKDNSVYVGLTFNFNVRNNQHMSKGTVFNYIKNKCSKYKYIQLTDYIDVEIARIKEGEFVEKYKKFGWNILNKSKTGAVGGKLVKWTFVKCKEEALKYKYRKDFRKNNNSAYNISLRNKWLDEICNHMTILWCKKLKK